MELNLYRIVPKYIDALRDETNGGDKRVYDVRNGKEHRPFVGVVVVCNGQKYCIPLTSYKKRFENMRDKIDITRIIIDGEIKGAVEFSRMIPIEDAQLRNLDMLYHKHDVVLQIKLCSILQIIWNRFWCYCVNVIRLFGVYSVLCFI